MDFRVYVFVFSCNVALLPDSAAIRVGLARLARVGQADFFKQQDEQGPGVAAMVVFTVRQSTP